jgi:hypothetical protein
MWRLVTLVGDPGHGYPLEDRANRLANLDVYQAPLEV